MKKFLPTIRFFSLAVLAFSVLFFSGMLSASVFVSEYSVSNSSTTTDNCGSYEYRIELCKAGNKSVNIPGFFLCDQDYSEKPIQGTTAIGIDGDLIVSNPWLKKVPVEYENHPEFGKTQPENPHATGSYELIDERTEHSRLFQNLDGTYVTVYSSYPLHVQSENGWWISIGEKAAETYSSSENITNYSTIEDFTIINSCFTPNYQESSLTIPIPAGDNILGSLVLWEFTAVNSGYLSDQRSYVSGPAGQTGVFTGTGDVEGTQVYNTSDPIANIVSPGEITIYFYSSRTWGGSDCNSTYNYLERRYIEVLHGEIQYGEGDIVINEYSVSNLETVTDNYSSYEDWIELYNTSEFWVDISDFYLSDGVTNPTKWQFPAGVVMPPGGFLRVWASGRDEVAGGHYHTNFRLTQTKDNPEYIILSMPDATIADSLQLQNTQLGHSRGRQPDGGETWKIFTSPTPGSSNNSATGYMAYAEKPVMSETAGFYVNPLSIAITSSEPNSEIRFTTNGHEPTTASTFYSQPVAVNETRIVIARTFSNNPQILPSLLDFNTYFIGVDHTLGAMSVSAGEIQQLLNGNQYLEPFGTFEYFNSDGVRTTFGYGEFNKHGQDSWVHPQRSIDYITRDECGYNYAIREQMIPFTDRDEFQRIIIRAHGDDNYPGNDSAAHLRDYFIQNFAFKGGMHLNGRRGQMGVLYANGDYWGVYGFREKLDHDYTSYYYNQDKFNLHYLKLWGGTWAQYGGQAAFDDWYDLRGFILNNDMADQANYEYVKTRIDYESFVDYIHINSFVVCTDWINWNVGWWRGLNPDGDMQRWRYTLWDEDATFNHYINYTGVPGTHPQVSPCFPEGITADPGLHIAVLNSLLENDEFRTYYVSRYVDLYNSLFKPDDLIPYLDEIEAEMLPEMPRHFTRWGGNMVKWQSNVQKIRNFINARYSYLPEGLSNCYNLNGPYVLTIQSVPEGVGEIRINSLTLDEFPFTGAYFGGIDIQISAATSNAIFEFDHWSINFHTLEPSDTMANVTLNLSAPDILTAHFNLKEFSDSLVINEINYRSADFFDAGDWVEFFNPHGYDLDITSWEFRDNDDTHIFIFPEGTVIPGLGYLVLVRDSADFSSHFPEVENFIGEMGFGFSSDGELIRLFNDSGALIDTVHYENSAPWPPEANGGGPTLELINWTYDNALPESWAASLQHGTPGAINGMITATPCSEKKEKPLSFTVYPNPMNESAILQVTSKTIIRNAQLLIYDSFGNLVRTVENINNDRMIISRGNLNQGIYICRLINGDSTHTAYHKIILR